MLDFAIEASKKRLDDSVGFYVVLFAFMRGQLDKTPAWCIGVGRWSWES